MDIGAARRRLENERARLRGILDASQREPARTEGVHPDQLPAEQAAETLNRELDSSVQAQVRAELDGVEAALGRLDLDRYGRCEVCGGEIPEGRLEALPAARFCVTDQTRAERDPRL